MVAKTITVRNVPDEVQRVLRLRAAHAGMSLSAYLRRELRDIATSLTLDEILDDAAENATGSFTFEDVNEAIRVGRARAS